MFLSSAHLKIIIYLSPIFYLITLHRIQGLPYFCLRAWMKVNARPYFVIWGFKILSWVHFFFKKYIKNFIFIDFQFLGAYNCKTLSISNFYFKNVSQNAQTSQRNVIYLNFNLFIIIRNIIIIDFYGGITTTFVIFRKKNSI